MVKSRPGQDQGKAPFRLVYAKRYLTGRTAFDRQCQAKQFVISFQDCKRLREKVLQIFTKYLQATSSFLRLGFGFFLFVDQCHSLDCWRISLPSHREKLFFFEMLVTVKRIVLVAADSISSLHIHS